MNAHQLTLAIIENAYGMWRFRWTALVIAWLVGLGGWLVVLALPNQYDSGAQVYVDTESTLKPLLSGLSVSTDTLNQVSMMTRALLSRPQLEKVVYNTGLKDRIESPEDLDILLQVLAKSIQVSKTPGENIYKIVYQDQNPVMARDVVQALLDNLMESSFRMDESDTAQAQAFLEGQIASYEQRLTEAEQRLAEFKKKNVGLMPGEGGDYYLRLQTAEAGVREISTKIQSVLQTRAELERQLVGEEPTFGIGMGAPQGGAGKSTSVSSTIDNFERQLSQLLLTFTDKHPDVVSLRKTLEDLYRMRDEELASQAGFAGPSTGPNIEMNPVYQEMRKQKSKADVDLVSLRAQLRERQEAVNYLKQMVDTIPEVEAQLNRLSRDYDVVKAQYEQLLQRLEAARLADDVREDSREVTFDIVEPPRVPLLASGPDRPILATVFLMIALGAAGGTAFLLNRSKPVFYSSHTLGNAFKLPVFGTIGISADAPAGKRAMFIVATTALFAVFLSVVIFGQAGIRPLVRAAMGV